MVVNRGCAPISLSLSPHIPSSHLSGSPPPLSAAWLLVSERPRQGETEGKTEGGLREGNSAEAAFAEDYGGGSLIRLLHHFLSSARRRARLPLITLTTNGITQVEEIMKTPASSINHHHHTCAHTIVTKLGNQILCVQWKGKTYISRLGLPVSDGQSRSLCVCVCVGSS